uniref:DDIT3 protein n=2 Tax=Anas TaxID=8835 RepID=U3I0R1_ANAPP
LAAGPAGGLPGWELEAWYQDLQEVLAAAEPTGLPAPWGAEQEGPSETAPLWGPEGSGSVPESCELDAALTAELQELLGPHSVAGTEAVQPPDPALCRSSPTPVGTEDEQAGHKAKRKRGSGQSNEQRVLELTARNEQLREEIRRLSAEVENTRRALINRIVNLRQT